MGQAPPDAFRQMLEIPAMSDITELLTDATTLWTAVVVLAVAVTGFLIGRRFVKKIG